MSIWHIRPTPAALNPTSDQTMAGHLGIVYTAVGDDYLEATMPVDQRTVQPFGLLHGGASVALAETVGSMAANCCIDPTRQFCVGLEINANHIRSARSGLVTGRATPVHLGKRTQVWQIEIRDEEERLVCTSRLTMSVLDRRE